MDFDTLWKEYESELTDFVRARLFDKSMVADIMQEVAIKIYKNQSTLATLDNSRAWLYKVTRNTLIDFYKKNDKAIPNDIDALELTRSEMENEEDTRELSDCLSTMMTTSLNESDHEILRLSIIEQYSIKEMASILTLSIDGTKSKLKRAKKKLSSTFFACCSLEKNKQGDIVDCSTHSQGTCRC